MTEVSPIFVITELTGISADKIVLHEDGGFLSRGYVIGDGEIVFKFPKQDFVKYDNEANIVNFMNTRNFGVNLQRVKWLDKNYRYIGFYGVKGKPLSNVASQLTKSQKENIGEQIGLFLKKLHSCTPQNAILKPSSHLEINTWQQRFASQKDFFKKYFTAKEIKQISKVLADKINILNQLGEKLVFCHRDIRNGNLFLDDRGKIGIIDFDCAGYYDEANDFLLIEDEYILEYMMDSYGASETLRNKIKHRREAYLIACADIVHYQEKNDEFAKRIKSMI